MVKKKGVKKYKPNYKPKVEDIFPNIAPKPPKTRIPKTKMPKGWDTFDKKKNKKGR